MSLPNGPADTSNYMILGYAVILGAMALYLISLWIRTRNAQRDVQALSELDKAPGHRDR